MLFGVLVGTYSSVYIAAPFLILIGVKRDWSGVEKGKAKAPLPGAQSGRPEPKSIPSPAATNAELALLDGNGLEVAAPGATEHRFFGGRISSRRGGGASASPAGRGAAQAFWARSSKKGKGQARAGGGRSKRRG